MLSIFLCQNATEIFIIGMVYLVLIACYDKTKTCVDFPPRYTFMCLVLLEKNLPFAYAKTKLQISCAVIAQLISTFVYASWIVQSLYFSSLEPCSVAVQLGLC